MACSPASCNQNQIPSMSPFMVLIVLATLALTLVFVVGLIWRKRVLLLVGLPGPLLLFIWYVLASTPPDPKTEFDRLFGADNRTVVSDIQTIKPTLMDGHFISFHISPADFDSRIRPSYSREMTLPADFLLGQRLPTGWPATIQSAETALSRDVENTEVFLLFIPEQQRAYATVRYEQW